MTMPKRKKVFGTTQKIMLNRKFGSYTVYDYVGRSFYAVVCDCGNKTKIRRFRLENMRFAPCSCQPRDKKKIQKTLDSFNENATIPKDLLREFAVYVIEEYERQRDIPSNTFSRSTGSQV